MDTRFFSQISNELAAMAKEVDDIVEQKIGYPNLGAETDTIVNQNLNSIAHKYLARGILRDLATFNVENTWRGLGVYIDPEWLQRQFRVW